MYLQPIAVFPSWIMHDRRVHVHTRHGHTAYYYREYMEKAVYYTLSVVPKFAAPCLEKVALISSAPMNSTL